MPSILEQKLADIEFKTRPYVPLIEVEVRDHSGLGSMAHQSTPTLKSFKFDSLEKAASFAKLLIERLDRPADADRHMADISAQIAKGMTLRATQTIHAGVDLGAFGVYLTLRNEEVVTGFTYEAPSVIRVIG